MRAGRPNSLNIEHVGAVYCTGGLRPYKLRDRAVIDCTYIGSRSASGTPNSLNSEHVRAVYCTAQIKSETATRTNFEIAQS